MAASTRNVCAPKIWYGSTHISEKLGLIGGFPKICRENVLNLLARAARTKSISEIATYAALETTTHIFRLSLTKFVQEVKSAN